MSKKQTTSVKSKQSWLKYGLLIFVGLMVVGVVAFWGYQNNLNKADVDRFAALQSDFKKLQVEFNKLDPGWEYREDCAAPHFVFDQGRPSCRTELRNNNKLHGQKEEYIAVSQSIVGSIDNASSQNTDTHKSLLRKGFNTVGKSYCAIDLGGGNSGSYVRCVGESKNFYFQKTD